MGRLWRRSVGLSRQRPVGLTNPQTWNRYAYVAGDPVNFVDPGGLQQVSVASAVWVWECFGGEGGHCTYTFQPPVTPVEGPADRSRTPQREIDVVWDELSEKCKEGLETAMPMRKGTWGATARRLRVEALERAWMAAWYLKKAAGAHGIDWRVLAAIGIRETGFRNIGERGGGQGRGVFQIDAGEHPDVSDAQAFDPVWAADWAAGLISDELRRFAALVDGTSLNPYAPALAAYNSGPKNVAGAIASENPLEALNGLTTGKNYVSNVLNLMECF